MNHPPSSIVLFDGYCNFCSSAINTILKYDKRNKFSFAASQSEKGIELLNQFHLKDVDSIILVTNGKSYRYSTAILKISKELVFPLNLLTVFFIVPAFIRDPVYKWFAKNRYNWFGKRTSCRIPSEKEKQKFL